MAKTVVLNSGGMDSFLAWWNEGKPENVFVDVGHGYAARERQALSDIRGAFQEFAWTEVRAAPIGTSELPSGIIPHRNAHLILAAATRGNDIVMGVLADEINSDKSPEFMSAMATVLSISHRGQYWNDGVGVAYTVRSPLRELTKTDALALYLASGGPVAPLLATVSCYAGTDRHCGACPSCFKRWVALTNCELPTDFARDPVAWADDAGVLRKARDGTYSVRRAGEIRRAMDRRVYG